MRIAAMADLHYGKTSHGKFKQVFSEISERADVLLICGDSTDFGLPEEALVLIEDLRTSIRIPVVAVLGNHDYESSKQEEISQIFENAGVSLLNGTAVEIHNIAFVGTKGFAGGFGERSLQPWGEDAIKRFVQETIDETTKLESALARLSTGRIVVLLHYSPIKDTVLGEDPETYAFLGSSRLEAPLTRQKLVAVFHGHAHNGTFKARMTNGTPVYNVARELLERTLDAAYYLLEVPSGLDGGKSK